MWEAALFAGHKKMDNLHLIVDDNDSIGKMIEMGDLSRKLADFGFRTACVNGHNHEEITAALSAAGDGRPAATIAKTVRGYGCKTLIEDAVWFHKAPDDKELLDLCAEVDAF